VRGGARPPGARLSDLGVRICTRVGPPPAGPKQPGKLPGNGLAQAQVLAEQQQRRAEERAQAAHRLRQSNRVLVAALIVAVLAAVGKPHLLPPRARWHEYKIRPPRQAERNTGTAGPKQGSWHAARNLGACQADLVGPSWGALLFQRSCNENYPGRADGYVGASADQSPALERVDRVRGALDWSITLPRWRHAGVNQLGRFLVQTGKLGGDG